MTWGQSHWAWADGYVAAVWITGLDVQVLPATECTLPGRLHGANTVIPRRLAFDCGFLPSRSGANVAGKSWPWGLQGLATPDSGGNHADAELSMQEKLPYTPISQGEFSLPSSQISMWTFSISWAPSG